MNELRRQHQENIEEVMENEILAEVLGNERRGHIPGLGPTPNKKKPDHQVEKMIEDRVANMHNKYLEDARKERQEFLEHLKTLIEIPSDHPIFGFQPPRPPSPPPPPPPASTVN